MKIKISGNDKVRIERLNDRYTLDGDFDESKKILHIYCGDVLQDNVEVFIDNNSKSDIRKELETLENKFQQFSKLQLVLISYKHCGVDMIIGVTKDKQHRNFLNEYDVDMFIFDMVREL